MSTYAQSLLAGVLLIGNVLALLPAAHAQAGEVYRIESPNNLPQCTADGNSPLCEVEKDISRAFYIGADESTTVAVGNWLFDVLFGTVGHYAPYKFRFSVVEASVIEYRVESRVVLDGDTVVEYRERERKYNPEIEWLRSGIMHLSIGVRYHDRGGLHWPPEGWRPYKYYFERSGQEWRLIKSSYMFAHDGRVSADSSSRTCIGNPKTPLCAVETWFACIARNDPELCDLITADASALDTGVSYFMSSNSFQFTVLRISPAGGTDTTPQFYEVILRNGITHDPENGSTTEEFVRFMVRRTGPGWRIVGNEIIRWTEPEHQE